MKIKRNLLAAGALVLGLLAAQSAWASNIMITYTGTATDITDPNDFFNLGDGVTSASFSNTYVFNLANGYRGNCCGADYIYGGTDWGTISPVVDATLTINGNTINLPVGLDDEVYYQPGDYAQASISTIGSVNWTFSTITFDGAVPSSLGTPFSATGTGNGYFFICALDAPVCNSEINTAAANFSPTSVVATISPSATPEPGTWALMLAGVGGVGGALRYGRRRQAAGFA